MVSATPQVLVRQVRHLAPTGRALDEALLDEERLVDFLYRARVLAQGGGDGGQAHGTALELVDDGGQQFVVYLVQAVAVDVQCLQGIGGNLRVDASRTFDLRKVPHTPQQRIGDTGRSAAARGNLLRRLRRAGHVQDARRAAHDACQHLVVIILQMQVDAEPRPQGSRQQAAARSGPHQREGVQVNLYASCRRALVYHDVDAVVLHRRVEVFLHHGREAVYLVDEEHVVRLQAGQDAGQIARLVQHGAGRDFEAHAQLVGNDVGEGRLAQSGRSVQQHMVQRLAPQAGRLDEDAQVVHHLVLAAEVLEAQGARAPVRSRAVGFVCRMIRRP